MSDLGLQKYKWQYETEVAKDIKKYETLRDLDVFVLDNSMRESTVGQLRGHTIEDKRRIFEEVKKCGFKHVIVASFNHMTRIDDVWMKMLIAEGEDPQYLWAFSEVTNSITKDRTPDADQVPVGLVKMKEAGLRNVLFEIDLADSSYDFSGQFSYDDMCALMRKWVEWCHVHLHPDSKVLINIRDIEAVMPNHSERVFQLVRDMAQLPEATRPFGMVFEEPGCSFPEECGSWARAIRRVMNENNWRGRLLVHVHEKWGYCDATNMQLLMDGADGVWAGLGIEGASMGQASTCVMLMNLIRMGNKKVLQQFNCSHLRKAAIEITKISTGKAPDSKQPVFGTRALDYVFHLGKDQFDLSTFFGEKAPIRMTTMASAEMIKQRLINVFGKDPQFNLTITGRMREIILEDLHAERKEEYMSMFGLALLFDRAGGSLTGAMSESMAGAKLNNLHGEKLIEVIRKMWDQWDSREDGKQDNMLQFDSFYNGFMSQYFSSYRSKDTKNALSAIDMDDDNMVDWNEFLVYLKWAFREYPKTETADELLEIAFTKGIIPASRDEGKSPRSPKKKSR